MNGEVPRGRAVTVRPILSFQLDVEIPDDGAPARRLGGGEGAKLLRTPRFDFIAGGLEPFHESARRDDLDEFAVEPLDDRLRRSGVGVEGRPDRIQSELWIAKLSGGLNVGQRL